MADIKQVVIDGATYNLKDPIARSCIAFGTVDSTSTSKAYTATIPGITEYFDGLAIMLKNGVVTSESGFTIDINGLGAKHSYNNMAAATADTTLFNVNYTMLFVYDSTRVSGGGWICYRGYDANTNTIGYQLRTNSRTRPVTDQTGRYRILFSSADNSDWVPPNTSNSTSATAAKAVNQRPINPWGEIAYYSYTTVYAAGTNVGTGYMWSQYVVTLGYSFNRTGAALTMTFPAPVYVKCAPQANGSAIIDETEPFVQELPSTVDGKIYIYLGNAYSATNVELVNWHPVYYYDGTGVRIWTGKVIPTKTSDLTNDSGFLTSAVTTFNGQSGAVTYTAPVTSVNGQTGDVTVPGGVTDVENEAGTSLVTSGVATIPNEVLVVNFTRKPSEVSGEYVFTKDKTYAEISAALNAGKYVVGICSIYSNASVEEPYQIWQYALSYVPVSSGNIVFVRFQSVLVSGQLVTISSASAIKISETEEITFAQSSYGKTNVYNSTSENAMTGIAVASAISGKQDVSNLVTSLSSSSTDTTYPSAKAVYDAIPTIPTNVSAFTNDAGYLTSYTETDPTVPSWAKASSKPTYTASEVGALPDTTVIPTKTSELTNDSGFLTSYTETDPTVPAWAKASTKPTYTAQEVGALPSTYTPPVTDVKNSAGTSLVSNGVATIPDAPSEKFIITITGSGTDANPYASDKTWAEISAAIEANKLVLVKIQTTSVKTNYYYLDAYQAAQENVTGSARFIDAAITLTNDVYYYGITAYALNYSNSTLTIKKTYKSHYVTVNLPSAAGTQGQMLVANSSGTGLVWQNQPTVPTNVSAFTNDSGYLTLATLPIYDGTVV